MDCCRSIYFCCIDVGCRRVGGLRARPFSPVENLGPARCPAGSPGTPGDETPPRLGGFAASEFRRRKTFRMFATFAFSGRWPGLLVGPILGVPYLVGYGLHRCWGPKLSWTRRRAWHACLSWTDTQMTSTCVVLLVQLQDLSSLRLLVSM